MREFDPQFELRRGTPFADLFIEPQALMVQPLRDEANEIFINQSLKRILDLEDPNSYPETAVDEIVENYFVFRVPGSRSSGSARVYYRTPKTINVTSGSLLFTSSDGQTYTNANAVVVSEQAMANQIEQDLFFIDIPLIADSEGDQFDLEVDELVGVNDQDAVRVTNPFIITGGSPRETNVEYITRAQQSIGERSLNRDKGIRAVFFNTFQNQLSDLRSIGFQDPEMMRDIRFNFHIGGNIDVWVKTPQIRDGFFDVVGLNIDTTRQLSTSTNLVLEGSTPVSLGNQNIDTSNNFVRGFDISNVNSSAVFYSAVDLEVGVDLSSGRFIGIALDQGSVNNVNIGGASVSQTQAGEIVNAINVALGQRVAEITINPTIVPRRTSGNTPADNQNAFRDPSVNIFRNVVPGDSLTILVGDNQETYTVQSVNSDNEVIVSSPIPFEQSNINYRISRAGTYIKIQSQTRGTSSRIVLQAPALGTDGLNEAFGYNSAAGPFMFEGLGEIEFQDGVDFNTDLTNGEIQRIQGPVVLSDTASGFVAKNIFFEDNSPNIFLNVLEGDVISVLDSGDQSIIKDYKVLEKINDNRLRVDNYFPVNESGITYRITRTGIKDGSTVRFNYDFNPLSIDIGDRIDLDSFGRVQGVRPGREERTITDLSLLYITSVELIDPVSGEPTGTVLEGRGGFGLGGFGRGGFGRGQSAQWFHQVVKPELRFSVLEDSFVVINTAFIGQSFRVNYKYVPEIQSFQDLADSDLERVLDGKIVVKHFIPAVVNIVLDYETDPNNPDTPSKDEVLAAIRTYINNVTPGRPIDASDLTDVIYEQIDPSRDRNVTVRHPINMEAIVYNTDSSLSIVRNSDRLQIPSEEIPPFSTRPLSPRTAHWIAGEIELNEIVVAQGIL